jgi:3-oxoacyl-[acyl-carrier protein] reductase
MGNPGQTNYSASKGGQIAFTKALAREVAARNITVNAIAPGFVDTEILDAMTPETLEAALKMVPLARKGNPKRSLSPLPSSLLMKPPILPARCSAWMAAWQ